MIQHSSPQRQMLTLKFQTEECRIFLILVSALLSNFPNFPPLTLLMVTGNSIFLSDRNSAFFNFIPRLSGIFLLLAGIWDLGIWGQEGFGFSKSLPASKGEMIGMELKNQEKYQNNSFFLFFAAENKSFCLGAAGSHQSHGHGGGCSGGNR